MATPLEPTIDALAKDLPALVLLGALVLVILYLATELRRTRERIEPLLDSPLVRGLAGA